MIVAPLNEAAVQAAATPNMKKAFAFLAGLSGRELADGRVDIDGEKVFALVQSYQSVAPGEAILLEAHHKYIDVQYMVAGREVIGWASTDRLDVSQPYDEAKEAWFGELPAASATLVRLVAGDAAVFYPTDGHAPRLADGAPAAVKKIVVKVAVGS